MGACKLVFDDGKIHWIISVIGSTSHIILETEDSRPGIAQLSTGERRGAGEK